MNVGCPADGKLEEKHQGIVGGECAGSAVGRQHGDVGGALSCGASVLDADPGNFDSPVRRRDRRATLGLYGGSPKPTGGFEPGGGKLLHVVRRWLSRP